MRRVKAVAFGCFRAAEAMALGFVLCVFASILSATGAAAQQQPAPPPPPAQQQQTQQPPQQQYPELPPGPGRDTLIRVCSQCHSPDNVLANGQDREGWENTITKMAGFGAQGTDDDFTAILEYLAKNFPPPAAAKVNVNKATAQELATALSLTPADAAAIVQYREKNGNFKSIDDLKKVPDVDTKKLDAQKARLTF